MEVLVVALLAIIVAFVLIMAMGDKPKGPDDKDNKNQLLNE